MLFVFSASPRLSGTPQQPETVSCAPPVGSWGIHLDRTEKCWEAGLVQQVKIFKSDEAGLSRLESEINQWLATSGVRIVQIFGNIAPQSSTTEFEALNPGKQPHLPSDVMITVLYETAHRA